MRILLVTLLFLPFFALSQINQTDSNGLRQGLWQKKQANGNLLYQGNFKDGNPIGEWKRYHEGGQVKAIISYNNDTAFTQLFDVWNKKVAEGNYINQKKEGIWIYYSENQKIAEEKYVNDKKEGEAKKYYDSGELMETCDWKNGLQDGNYFLFFKNGDTYLKCKMANNQRNGLCIISYKNGKQELVANYKNGLRHGEWKYYNENGEYLYTLNYNLGKLLNPQIRDSLDNIQMQTLEKNKSFLLDPEKFMQDPGEYMMKKKIYQ